MSYDLAFWRVQRRWRREAPTVTYRRLLADEPVKGLSPLPVTDFLLALAAAFPGSVRERNGAGEWQVWEAPDGKRMFETTWSAYHFLATCRGLSNDEMNKIIDVGLSFDCPLYDPQTNERFDG